MSPDPKARAAAPTPAEQAKAAEAAAAADKAAVAGELAVDKTAQDAVDAKEAKAKDTEDRFPKEELIGRMRLALDYPAHVVAGALHGVEQDELTLKEANAACKAWMSSKIVPVDVTEEQGE